MWYLNRSAFFVQLGFYVCNWQNVQLNTDLLKRRTWVFIHKLNRWLKVNEIKSDLKVGN
jgi:hypothetical protein